MPDNKRILYVGGFQLPDKNAAAHRVLGIGKSLRDAGYIVEYLDVSDEIYDDKLSCPWECQNFTVYSQKHSNSALQRVKYTLYPLHAEEILQKHDDWYAAIMYNYPAVAMAKLKRICHKRSIKVFADCTEWYAFSPKTLRGFLTYIDSEVRMRIVQKHLDGVIAISRYLGEYYKKHLPTVIIPPTVDLTEEKWHQIIKKTSSGDGVIRLVYAGSPGKNKDSLNKIVEAVLECEIKVQLEIVGINESQYLDMFPKDSVRVDSLKESDKIVFLGRMSHSDSLKVLQSADYAVFFRPDNRVTRAGFPTKFAEAISSGTAVITTDSSNVKDYIRGNGYIVKEREFSKKLAEIHKNNFEIEIRRDIFEYSFYTDILLGLIERRNRKE